MTTPADTAPFRVQHARCRCDEAPREPLFEWVEPAPDVVPPNYEPDVVKYEIPSYFEAHVALDYLEILETRGGDAAFRWAVITAVGHAGWQALRSPGMDDATFQKIAQVILNRVRGAQSRGPKG